MRMSLATLLLPALGACGSPYERPPLPPSPRWTNMDLGTPPAADRPPVARARGAAPMVTGTASSPDAALRAQLARTRVRGLLVRGEESLRSVIEAVRTHTGLPLVVAPAAEEAALDAGVVFDLDLQHALAAASVLNLITEMAGPDVDWTVRHGVVLVTTADKARGALRFGAYDVRMLTAARTDFTAPRLELRLLGEREEDDLGGAASSVPRMEADELLTLIQDNVEPATWSDEGVSLDLHNGVLLLRHTPAVHLRVRKLLALLGA
jgi:hypothetical protein